MHMTVALKTRSCMTFLAFECQKDGTFKHLTSLQAMVSTLANFMSFVLPR
jgi:hypothetical protein